MKKITFMFIFLIYSVGFSQTNNSGNVPISDLGDNNPTHAQSEPRVSSNVETIAISDLGDNNPTYAQSEPRVSSNVETITISSLGGDNNPTYAQSEPRVYSDARTIPIPGTSDYKQGFENLVSIPFIPNQNGAGSDDCTGATDVFAGETYVGNTGDYTDTGGNAAPDVWYAYSGSAGAVTLSLCDGATDYDSYLRVYDACDGTEIAGNDDSCDLQSELTFIANGTSTYYIMVEGFGSNSGNFSLEVFCELLGTNDNTIEGFSFYPNPATDAINLSSTENIERVTIYNILGQKVIDQDINATSSQLNVSNLVTGAYLMQVSVDGKTATYKVLKN